MASERQKRPNVVRLCHEASANLLNMDFGSEQPSNKMMCLYLSLPNGGCECTKATALNGERNSVSAKRKFDFNFSENNRCDASSISPPPATLILFNDRNIIMNDEILSLLRSNCLRSQTDNSVLILFLSIWIFRQVSIYCAHVARHISPLFFFYRTIIAIEFD